MRLLGRAFVLAAFWVPLAICMTVAVTPDPIGVVAGLSGWIAHICAFAYLTTALFQAHLRWPNSGIDSAARCVLAAVLWMLAFGVVIEVAQLFVAGRSGDLVDLLPDGVGIAIGCGLRGGWARVASHSGGSREP